MTTRTPWRPAALLTGLVLLTAACGGGTTRSDVAQQQSSAPAGAASSAAADPNAPIKQGLKVAFLPKQVNNPYFTIANQGGISAAAEYGGEGKEVGPSDASASSQVSYINTLTQQKQDAIVISANDPNAVVPALKQAMAAGIKVVSYDSDTAADGRQIFVNQASAEDLGRTEVQLLAEQIGHKGKIAVLSATPNATNQNAWIEFMKDELTKPEFKDMELVKVAYGNDDDQKSFTETQGLLRSYPDLAGIISPTTVGIAAAARYLSDSPYKGKVKLTGLGTPNQLRKFVKDGTIDAFELWNPADLGYLASYAAAALASGQITGAEGERFKAGRLGEYTVGAKGEVLLGKPTVFDKDNIDDFDF
ncbi:rhamnose ABC transporter substrate-binding protein [Nonomuraea jiangxiensis]|uniref:Rhamnose transport system substrate-binding protein n=1 Tax=Nonomuraea jiangxiensis TaxID=633440 RepID=A0A1G8EZW8_9ACTN|nr:rhamnose ABC transporter substrate-binding protein [Nonomuraea jiangxiensis]SDH75412.1 rhamnose transport system substrate-binding protein [Nonomuraea jiangxiensis]